MLRGPKNLSLHEKNVSDDIYGGPKVNFPLRTLNKISKFIAELLEALFTNSVFFIGDSHN